MTCHFHLTLNTHKFLFSFSVKLRCKVSLILVILQFKALSFLTFKLVFSKYLIHGGRGVHSLVFYCQDLPILKNSVSVMEM